MEQVRQAVGTATGTGTGARGGHLPKLETETEPGWERKEGEGGTWGAGGRGERGAGGRGERRGLGAGAFYDEEELTSGVPGKSRERCPVDWTEWWNDWKFGLTYDNTEWG